MPFIYKHGLVRLTKSEIKDIKKYTKVYHILIFLVVIVILLCSYFVFLNVYDIQIYSDEIKITDVTQKIVADISKQCFIYSPFFTDNKVSMMNKYSYDSCMENKIYEFVIENTDYVSDDIFETSFLLNNNINHTLQQGGDCENKAILALSLLKTLNVKNIYFAAQEHHACWIIQYDSLLQTYNCDDNKPILIVEEVN